MPITLFTLSNLCCFYRSIILNETFGHCLYEATIVVFIVQLSSTRRLTIVYMKQPLLFLSCNYPQRAGYPLYILSNLFFIVQLSSTRRLAIGYIKQPLLFLSFNYPQRDVLPLFI